MLRGKGDWSWGVADGIVVNAAGKVICSIIRR